MNTVQERRNKERRKKPIKHEVRDHTIAIALLSLILIFELMTKHG